MITGKIGFINITPAARQADRQQTEHEKGNDQKSGSRIFQSQTAFFLNKKFYQQKQEKGSQPFIKLEAHRKIVPRIFLECPSSQPEQQQAAKNRQHNEPLLRGF